MGFWTYQDAAGGNAVSQDGEGISGSSIEIAVDVEVGHHLLRAWQTAETQHLDSEALNMIRVTQDGAVN